MADVWEAEVALPTGGKRIVALKRIRPQLESESTAVQLFLYEARLAMRLEHPNIVRALDAGEVAGEPFMALELVDGIDLRKLFRESGPLPIGFAVWAVRELCTALDYAHSFVDAEGRWLAIVHRDVSPTNVMVGRDGSVKLIDFGVAKALHDDDAVTTRQGTIKGKVGYMAPEVTAGRPFDHRADLFSLGVILWELITNQRLFQARSAHEAVALNRACEVVRPSLVNPEVPQLLDEIAMRALAREPQDRYKWAREMAIDLEQALVELPWDRQRTIDLVDATEVKTTRQKKAEPPTTRRKRPPRRRADKLRLARRVLLATAFLLPLAFVASFGDGAASAFAEPEAPARVAPLAVTVRPPATPPPEPSAGSPPALPLASLAQGGSREFEPHPPVEPARAAKSAPRGPRKRSPRVVLDRKSLIDPLAFGGER